MTTECQKCQRTRQKKCIKYTGQNEMIWKGYSTNSHHICTWYVVSDGELSGNDSRNRTHKIYSIRYNRTDQKRKWETVTLKTECLEVETNTHTHTHTQSKTRHLAGQGVWKFFIHGIVDEHEPNIQSTHNIIVMEQAPRPQENIASRS